MTRREKAFWTKLAEQSDAIECDCGKPKRDVKDEACTDCTFLDGSHDSESALIEVLRLNVEMTAVELAEEFGVHPTGMLNRLTRMMEKGRVTRQMRDTEAREHVGRSRHGGTQRHVRVGCGTYYYRLCDRRAA